MKHFEKASRLRRQDILYLLLAIVLVVGGYLWLRAAYRVAEQWPFTQEVLLVILGIVATVLITALLLNKQTEVELEKEWSLKFTELKVSNYTALLDLIEHVLASGNIDEQERQRLQFITHKLALVAGPNVLREYQRFLEVFERASKDSRYSEQEVREVHEALARLTAEIRKDLLGESDHDAGYSDEAISRQIMDNVREQMRDH
jgi:hypothetical protein